MIPLIVISIYLAVVLYIGIFAFRRGKSTGEDFFVASRSIGSIVFFLSLFATNMTSVAILGSSGIAYKRGIGIFGMMATISGFVIPLSLFVIGTRLWALGKRFGHMTQVAFFRDRWECSAIGTVIFALSAAMLIPYLIVSIVGGGTILEALTGGRLSYHVAGAIVALVVMGNVFFGGMRGAVLVNVFQTILFLSFGVIAFAVIGHNMPNGFTGTVHNMLANPNQAWALARSDPHAPPAIATITPLEFFSYCFIPLSSIMFPHMSIMCLTAKRVTAFKKTVMLYPLCIMAIWLPCVYLGAVANGQPRVTAAIAAMSPNAKAWIESGGTKTADGRPLPLAGKLGELAALEQRVRPGSAGGATQLLADVHARKLSSEEFGERLVKVVGPLKEAKESELKGQYGPTVQVVAALAKSASTDDVLLQMLRLYVPAALAGILAAGIISAVMGSDCHQILALSTMFTKDVFDYYGGRRRFGEKGTIVVGRTFIIFANALAYAIAWVKPPIFELAISWAFTGFAALAPVMLAALFWKRSTKYGALLAVLFVAASILAVGWVENHWALPKGTPPKEVVVWAVGGKTIMFLSKGAGRLFIFGFMPVVFVVLGSAVCVAIGSLVTAPPSDATIRKYFEPESEDATSAPTPVGARATIAT